MIYLIVFFVVWALACCWAVDQASLPVVQEYRVPALPVVDDGRGQERALEAQLRLLDPLLEAQAWRDEMVLLDRAMEEVPYRRVLPRVLVILKGSFLYPVKAIEKGIDYLVAQGKRLGGYLTSSFHSLAGKAERWWRSLHLVRVIMARATYYKGPKPPPAPKRQKSRRPYETPPPKFEPMLPKGVWRRVYPDGHQVTSRERQAGRRRKDLSKAQFAFDLADTQGWGSWA